MWRAAEEHHLDGGRHWHCYVAFHEVFRKRGGDAFDVAGIHPNIQTSKNTPLDQLKMWNYLHKEGYNSWGPWEGPSSSKEVPKTLSDGMI